MAKKNEITNKIARTAQDKVVDVIIAVVMVTGCIISLFPLYYTIVASVSNPALVATGKVIFWPKDFTLIGYEEVFGNSTLWRGYLNTFLYTIVGTFLNLAVTLPGAFALSRKTLPYRGLIFAFFMIPMYFGGGTAASYVWINELKLVNTFWVMVIPHGISTFNLIICRNYFDSNIPDSLFESATLDGASVTQYFFKFVLPLSKPIISVMGLYFAIPKWNDYMTGMIYIQDMEKQTLQYVIKSITESTANVDPTIMDPEDLTEQDMKQGILKYSVIIVAALPLYILYPAVQKYLISGVMVGSVKE